MRDAVEAPAINLEFRFIKILLPCFDFLLGEPSLTRGLQHRRDTAEFAIGDYPDATSGQPGHEVAAGTGSAITRPFSCRSLRDSMKTLKRLRSADTFAATMPRLSPRY